MSYRRALLGRWSRRDRLAVVVVALSVAFLVGTTLLVLAAGDQTAAIATEFETPGAVERYDSVAAARAVAPTNATVLPVATARLDGGRRVTVVARTERGRRLASERGIDLFAADSGATGGRLDAPREIRFAGAADTVRIEVRPRDRTVLSPAWYVADPGTVDRLGTTGALVVDPAAGPTPDRGVPLLSALAFFLLGTRETLRALSVAAVGGGLLVGVTVYSVARMAVRDRLATIRVARATGAPPRHVLAVFGLRGAAIAGVGSALGYAAGVILPSAAVNVAVIVSLPTSLSVGVTPGGARIVAAVLLATVGVGGMAGVVAAWPAVRTPPGRLRDERTSRNAEGAVGPDRWAVAPRLLGRETLVPTAATLTAFVVFAALVAAMAGAVAPLAAGGGATITEPGAVHPIASDVPEGYARALRARGIAASPEILAFAVADGRPFVARGVNATSFMTVTDAELAGGRRPTGKNEALVGAGLARTLGVDRGDRLLLGGSTDPAVTEVEIVGIVDAPGAFDDQLYLTLPAARHLTNRPPGRVQFVRAERSPDADPGAGGIGVIDVSVPERAPANATVEVAVTVRNDGLSEAERAITVSLGGVDRSRRVTLPPGAERRLAFTFPTGPPGTERLRVGSDAGGAETREVRVVPAGAIELRGVPGRAPPGSAPLVSVVTLLGDPVPGATVTAGDRTVVTGTDGRVRVPLDAPGSREIIAERNGSTATAAVSVEPGTRRALPATLRVSPSAPSLLVRPEARLSLANPWNRTLSPAVRIEGPGGTVTRSPAITPGEEATITRRLPARPPGSYEVRATIDGRVVAETSYAVSGDERVAAAIAGRARGGSGIGRAVETAFGNLELLLAVVVGLAGLMTAGGATATFARAVHARRRTIGVYRATGASPARVFRVVLADAARIGTAATAIALLAGTAVLLAFDAAGFLTAFGIGLDPVPGPAVAAGIAAGALAVSLLGAALATAGLLRATPGSLLAGGREAHGSRDPPANSGGGTRE